MIVKFRIISAENEEFVRDIEIIDDNSFYNFHMAIQSACGYDSSLMSTFYLSNESWDKEQEIVLEKMDEDSQSEVLMMQDTWILDMAPVVGQRFIYIFDFFSVRSFFIEIVNIRKFRRDEQHLEFPICTLSHGEAPKQLFIDETEITDLDLESEDLGDDFDDINFENIDDLDI